MIKFETFKQLWSEAKEYDDIDMYVMERGWQEWMNGIGTDTIVQLLNNIYDCSRGDINTIFEHYSTLRQASNMLCIPYSTCQKWTGGNNNPPDYTKMWMAYITICGK